jgi:uncharacterized protein (DUF934 family)
MDKFIIMWQFGDEGIEANVRLASADTLAEAVAFVERLATVAVIHDRFADGYPYTDTPVIKWQSPNFAGKVAKSLRVAAAR